MKCSALFILLFLLPCLTFSQNLMLLVERDGELKQKIMVHEVVEVKLNESIDSYNYLIGRVTSISNIGIWLDTINIPFENIRRIGHYQGHRNAIRALGILSGTVITAAGARQVLDKRTKNNLDQPFGFSMVFMGIATILSHMHISKPTYRIRENDRFTTVSCDNL